MSTRRSERPQKGRRRVNWPRSETNTFHNSLPEFENFCFDLEEISSGSTTTHSDISLQEYEAFYFDDDHIEEISGGSTTTHSDISLSKYDSFNFDLSNDRFFPTDRSDFTHEEFANELAHIISPPEYDCFYFRNLPDPGELISILNSGIRENLSTTRVNLPVEDNHFPLLAYVVKDKQEKDKIRTKRTKTGSVEKPGSVEDQSQSRKQEKRRKYKFKGPNWQFLEVVLIQVVISLKMVGLDAGLSQLWEVLYSRVDGHRLLIDKHNVFGGSLAMQYRDDDVGLYLLWFYVHGDDDVGTWEVILFYNGLDVPTRKILDSKGAIPTKTVVDAKVVIQEMAEYSKKWHNGTSRTRSTKTSNELAVIHAQLNSLGREIKKVNTKVYVVQVGCELYKGPHYTKDCPIKEYRKTLEEAYYTQFSAPYQPGGQYRAAGAGLYQRNNGNSSYPDRRKTIEESLTKS
nr:hypothetical protein [Tanacetum cinerariifolium]